MDNDGSGIALWVAIDIVIVLIVTVAVYFYRSRSSGIPFGTITNPNSLEPIGPGDPLVPIIPPDNLPNTITNCGHYGNRVAPGDYCPAGKALYG
ncbi:Hypothetical protein POVR1_LOCUS270 [uncultured virus]|nr:Hypothetical protein POVR1_LOCUS270 [uncultured virus]